MAIDYKARTAQIRNYAESINKSGKYCYELGNELDGVGKTINSNWEGDTVDLKSLNDGLEECIASLIIMSAAMKEFYDRSIEIANKVDFTAERARRKELGI